MSTTRPRSPSRLSGRSPGVFSQWSLPVKSGARPRTGRSALGAVCTRRESKRDGPRRSASRRSTPAERSMAPVGFDTTAGSSFASTVWKRTSSSAAIATAVPMRSAPSACWTVGPWPARRMRSMARRPPKARSRSTVADPAPYASARSTRSAEEPWVAEIEITAARNGPAPGAYTKPRAPPTSTPDQNPWPAERGPSRWSGAKPRSTISPRRGHRSATPKPASTTIASVRAKPSARPTPSITEASATIVIVWVSTRPAITPSGRRRPPVALADRSAGSTGKTHGVRAVPAPAMTAKIVRSAIGAPSLAAASFDCVNAGSANMGRHGRSTNDNRRARLHRRTDAVRRGGDDSRHRRGSPARRRGLRGNSRLRRTTVRARRPSRPSRALRREPPPLRRPPSGARGRGPGAAGGSRRGRVRRLPAHRAHPRRSPPAPDGAAAADPGAYSPGRGGVRAHSRPRRRQVPLLRRQHARRPARPRAWLRRGPTGHPSRPRARGADLLSVLGRRRRNPLYAAARRAHTRLDHARPRDGGRAGERASLHDGRPPRRPRGIPRLHDPRGAVDRCNRGHRAARGRAHARRHGEGPRQDRGRARRRLVLA